MSVKKPESSKLYRKELPKVGIDLKPGQYESDYKKLNNFQIIVKGMLREEMEPKQYLKYDSIKTEFKIYLVTGIITYGLFYIAFHSSFMSGPATEVYEPSLLARGMNNALDFIADQWNNLSKNIKSIF
jgi:hypothetical protein